MLFSKYIKLGISQKHTMKIEEKVEASEKHTESFMESHQDRNLSS